MGFNSHRGTVGHSIGKSIIGKGDDSPMPPATPSKPGSLRSMSVEFAHNGGVSVQHRLHPPKGKDSYDPSLEQTHMFRDATEAHRHIGELMGIRMASGEQRD